MNSPLLNLKDIHEPEAIGWWPPAIGWWILAVAIPLLIIFLVWLYKKLTRKTAIKTANQLLAQIKADTARDSFQKLCDLSILIRRVAMSTSPRTQVAGLTGREWLAFLDKSVKNAPFSEGIGQLLAEAPYRKSPPTELEIAQLIDLCEEWLKSQAKS